jgi:hypothetical protein
MYIKSRMGVNSSTPAVAAPASAPDPAPASAPAPPLHNCGNNCCKFGQDRTDKMCGPCMVKVANTFCRSAGSTKEALNRANKGEYLGKDRLVRILFWKLHHESHTGKKMQEATRIEGLAEINGPCERVEDGIRLVTLPSR